MLSLSVAGRQHLDISRPPASNQSTTLVMWRRPAPMDDNPVCSPAPHRKRIPASLQRSIRCCEHRGGDLLQPRAGLWNTAASFAMPRHARRGKELGELRCSALFVRYNRLTTLSRHFAACQAAACGAEHTTLYHDAYWADFPAAFARHLGCAQSSRPLECKMKLGLDLVHPWLLALKGNTSAREGIFSRQPTDNDVYVDASEIVSETRYLYYLHSAYT